MPSIDDLPKISELANQLELHVLVSIDLASGKQIEVYIGNRLIKINDELRQIIESAIQKDIDCRIDKTKNALSNFGFDA